MAKSHEHHMAKAKHHKEKAAHHMKMAKSAKGGSKSEYGSMDKKPLSDAKPTAKGAMKKW